MHIFVTGASGWVGSAVVAELVAAGHRVAGLVRTMPKARALAAQGVRPVLGTLDDVEMLRAQAAASDAVIHTAFDHDFSRFAENAQQDCRAIEALGSGLAGSARPLLVTSGLAGLPRGATEEMLPDPATLRKSEQTARRMAESGVRAATVRLAPSVHGMGGDQGFVAILATMARQKGLSGFVGDGGNCWSGVHRCDAARLYRLALERGVDQSVYHAVTDEAVPFRAIAEVIGRQIDVPAGSCDPAHFGWFARMATADMSASSAQSRKILGWEPGGPGLLCDLDQPGYYMA